MSTTPATPGPYSGTSITATTPASQPPGLAEAYTDAQLQAAIDAAVLQAEPEPEECLLHTSAHFTSAWRREAPNRLAISRAFLAALPKQDHFADASKKVEPDLYVRLKAYNEAGARIRFIKMDWRVGFEWNWKSPAHCFEVHPDDLHLCPEYAPKAQPWTPKPGDVVRLKSGGPEMTVSFCGIDGSVNCDWFDDIGHPYSKSFPATSLTPAKEGQP